MPSTDDSPPAGLNALKVLSVIYLIATPEEAKSLLPAALAPVRWKNTRPVEILLSVHPGSVSEIRQLNS